MMGLKLENRLCSEIQIVFVVVTCGYKSGMRASLDGGEETGGEDVSPKGELSPDDPESLSRGSSSCINTSSSSTSLLSCPTGDTGDERPGTEDV